MTLLKTLHDTDRAEPNRIKYDGDLVYAGFDIVRSDPSDETRLIAVLDCLSSYEIHDRDDTAFVDLSELQHAINLVRAVPYIDAVETPHTDAMEGGE